MTTPTKVTTWYLEMTDPGRLRPAPDPGPEFDVRRAGLPCPEINRFFYGAVGGAWHWRDRLDWDERRWLEWLDRPELQTWIGYLSGTPVGYYELESQAGGDVEIAYFGLLPSFVGRGLGAALLTRAIRDAWNLPGARRVWCHTCTLDHEAALPNYEARGLRRYKEESSVVELPAPPAGD